MDTNLNLNYLYNKNGQTIAVKKGSKEGQAIENGTVVKDENGEEWYTLDSVTSLDDLLKVEELDVNKIITAFSNGNLTVEELENWCEKNNVTDLSKSKEQGIVRISFSYHGKSYIVQCAFEDTVSQTDAPSAKPLPVAEAPAKVYSIDKNSTEYKYTEKEILEKLAKFTEKSDINGSDKFSSLQYKYSDIRALLTGFYGVNDNEIPEGKLKQMSVSDLVDLAFMSEKADSVIDKYQGYIKNDGILSFKYSKEGQSIKNAFVEGYLTEEQLEEDTKNAFINRGYSDFYTRNANGKYELNNSALEKYFGADAASKINNLEDLVNAYYDKNGVTVHGPNVQGGNDEIPEPNVAYDREDLEDVSNKIGPKWSQFFTNVGNNQYVLDDNAVKEYFGEETASKIKSPNDLVNNYAKKEEETEQLANQIISSINTKRLEGEFSEGFLNAADILKEDFVNGSITKDAFEAGLQQAYDDVLNEQNAEVDRIIDEYKQELKNYAKICQLSYDSSMKNHKQEYLDGKSFTDTVYWAKWEFENLTAHFKPLETPPAPEAKSYSEDELNGMPKEVKEHFFWKIGDKYQLIDVEVKHYFGEEIASKINTPEDLVNAYNKDKADRAVFADETIASFDMEALGEFADTFTAKANELKDDFINRKVSTQGGLQLYLKEAYDEQVKAAKKSEIDSIPIEERANKADELIEKYQAELKDYGTLCNSLFITFTKYEKDAFIAGKKTLSEFEQRLKEQVEIQKGTFKTEREEREEQAQSVVDRELAKLSQYGEPYVGNFTKNIEGIKQEFLNGEKAWIYLSAAAGEESAKQIKEAEGKGVPERTEWADTYIDVKYMSLSLIDKDVADVFKERHIQGARTKYINQELTKDEFKAELERVYEYNLGAAKEEQGKKQREYIANNSTKIDGYRNRLDGELLKQFEDALSGLKDSFIEGTIDEDTFFSQVEAAYNDVANVQEENNRSKEAEQLISVYKDGMTEDPNLAKQFDEDIAEAKNGFIKNNEPNREDFNKFIQEKAQKYTGINVRMKMADTYIDEFVELLQSNNIDEQKIQEFKNNMQAVKAEYSQDEGKFANFTSVLQSEYEAVLNASKQSPENYADEKIDILYQDLLKKSKSAAETFKEQSNQIKEQFVSGKIDKETFNARIDIASRTQDLRAASTELLDYMDELNGQSYSDYEHLEQDLSQWDGMFQINKTNESEDYTEYSVVSGDKSITVTVQKEEDDKPSDDQQQTVTQPEGQFNPEDYRAKLYEQQQAEAMAHQELLDYMDELNGQSYSDYNHLEQDLSQWDGMFQINKTNESEDYTEYSVVSGDKSITVTVQKEQDYKPDSELEQRIRERDAERYSGLQNEEMQQAEQMQINYSKEQQRLSEENIVRPDRETWHLNPNGNCENEEAQALFNDAFEQVKSENPGLHENTLLGAARTAWNEILAGAESSINKDELVEQLKNDVQTLYIGDAVNPNVPMTEEQTASINKIKEDFEAGKMSIVDVDNALESLGLKKSDIYNEDENTLIEFINFEGSGVCMSCKSDELGAVKTASRQVSDNEQSVISVKEDKVILKDSKNVSPESVTDQLLQLLPKEQAESLLKDFSKDGLTFVVGELEANGGGEYSYDSLFDNIRSYIGDVDGDGYSILEYIETDIFGIEPENSTFINAKGIYERNVFQPIGDRELDKQDVNIIKAFVANSLKDLYSSQSDIKRILNNDINRLINESKSGALSLYGISLKIATKIKDIL